MKKVVNVSLGGRSFILNEDASTRLQDYLALLKAGADENQIDLVLKTDLPESMDELMNGGQIVFPDGVMGRKIVDNGLGADIVMPDDEEPG